MTITMESMMASVAHPYRRSAGTNVGASLADDGAAGAGVGRDIWTIGAIVAAVLLAGRDAPGIAFAEN